MSGTTCGSSFAWGALGGLTVAVVALGLFWVLAVESAEGSTAAEPTPATEVMDPTSTVPPEPGGADTTIPPSPTTVIAGPATTDATVPPETTTTEAVPRQPEEIYATICAECHGVDREGDVGPTLGPQGHFGGHSDEELIELVSGGRDEMPPFRDVLSIDEIIAVIEWFRAGLEEHG
jgi:mono/diheme cytochrome c family protein